MMEEITLEKIDAVRDRTGVSYREAKDALEQCGGSVIETLIYLEDSKQPKWTEEFSVRSGEVIDKVKELVREGNINRIRIKQDGKALVEIPVALGALGAVVMPQIAALGVLVAVFKRCTIEVVRNEETPEDADKDHDDTNIRDKGL
jgi:hypothetical protein